MSSDQKQQENNSTTIMDEGEAILDSGSLFDVEGLMMDSNLTTPSSSNNGGQPHQQHTTPSTNNDQQIMNQQISAILHSADSRSNEDSTTSGGSTNPAPTTSTRRKRATSSASTTSRRNSTASTTAKPRRKKNDHDLEDEEGRSSSNEETSIEDTLSHAKLLPNQRTACPMEEVPSNQQGRYWIFETCQQGDLTEVVVRVTMKIRGEEAKNYVPEKLYSSHKYVIMHEISGKALVDKYPLIVSKIHVINPATREELKNSKNTSKFCLMGTMETALTKSSSGGKKSTSSEEVVKGQMKVQFTDVSYHHEKGHFGFIIHYFNPGNLEKPLFSLIAPPFNVFARKPTNENQTETLQPTKPKPSKKKRKSTDPVEDDGPATAQDLIAESSTSATPAIASSTNPSHTAQEEPIKKKTRRQTKKQNRANTEDAQQDAAMPVISMHVSQPSQNMQLFNSKLEAILAIKKSLGQDANKKASELALQNLLVLDPIVAQNFVLSTSSNPQSSDNVGPSGTNNVQ